MHLITNSLLESSEIDIIISLTIKNRPTTITKYEKYKETRTKQGSEPSNKTQLLHLLETLVS
jgi:hypothetical protein